MQSKDVLVRLQALDGVWEVGGVDRKRGIVPELGDLVADEWGPLEATFDLRRDTRAPWPDLGAFTPVEIEIGGVLVWSGFISETPTQGDRLMSVKCKGWQAHLDDDQYEPFYVHNKLGDWKDARSSLSATLSTLTAAPQVQSGAGMLSVTWPGGTAANGTGAVVLDAGPGRLIKRIVAVWSLTAGTANRAWGFGSADVNDGANLTDATTVYSATGASSGTAAWTLPTARRYVFIWHDSNSHTPAADEALSITDVLVFADTAYESGNASVLQVPTVIGDALNRATVLLSDDRTGIDPDGLATFALPSFAPSEPQTPREVWAAVNALYDWRSAIDVNRRAIFEEKATAPVFEVGEWSPFELADSSANSGDEIYNRVIVTGQTPDGTPVRVERTAGQQDGATVRDLTSRVPNPSFDTNTTGWGVSAGSIARDTGTFDTSPAAGNWTDGIGGGPIDGAILGTSLTGTFVAGITYAMQFRIRLGANVPFYLLAQLGDITTAHNYTELDMSGPSGALLSTTWVTRTVTWTPIETTTTVNFRLKVAPNTTRSNVYLDTLKLLQAVPTLVDRRGFRRTKRLPVSMPLPSDGVLAQRLGDTWLAGHKLTPFKGDTTIVGDHAVRHILTGRNVPLERLLLATTGLLRFSDRPDPDTGAHGRDGRLTKVIYNHPRNDAKISIDNTRTSFEALVGRLSAVISG